MGRARVSLAELQKQRAYDLFNDKPKSEPKVKKPKAIDRYDGWYDCFLNVKRSGNSRKLSYSWR